MNLTVLILFTTLFASAEDSGILDRILQEQIVCIKERAEVPLNSPDSCENCDRKSDLLHSEYFEELTQLFCSKPQAFCERILTQKDQRFVGPNCEPGIPPGFALEDSAFRRVLKADNAKKDLELGRKMLQAWGCEKKYSSEFRNLQFITPTLEYECDLMALPKGFSCGWDKNDKTYDSDLGALSNPKARSGEVATALMKANTSRMFVKLGDGQTQPKCTIQFQVEVEDAPELARLDTRSTHEEYVSTLSKSDQEKLNLRLNKLEEHSLKSFAQASVSLKGIEPVNTINTVRMAVADGRWDKTKKDFEASKMAMLTYLSTLQPPAPKAVVDQVKEVELFDLEAVTKGGLYSDDLKKLEANCFGEGDGISSFNALTVPYTKDGKPKRRLYICPEMLLSYSYMNPNGISHIMLHEMGHIFDQCTLDSQSTGYNPAKSACDSTPKINQMNLSPAEKKDFQEFSSRVAAVGTCAKQSPAVEPLSVRNDSGDPWVKSNFIEYYGHQNLREKFPDVYRGYRPKAQSAVAPDRWRQFEQARNQEFELQEANYKNYLERTAVFGEPTLTKSDLNALRKTGEGRCWRKNIKQGLLTTCTPPIDLPEAVGMKYDNGPKDQRDEIFADLVASEAAYFLYTPPSPKSIQAHERPLKQAEVLTSIGGTACLSEMDSSKDSHPALETRVSVFAGATGLRKLVGCKEAEPTRGARFPLGSCVNNLNKK